MWIICFSNVSLYTTHALYIRTNDLLATGLLGLDYRVVTRRYTLESWFDGWWWCCFFNFNANYLNILMILLSKIEQLFVSVSQIQNCVFWTHHYSYGPFYIKLQVCQYFRNTCRLLPIFRGENGTKKLKVNAV